MSTPARVVATGSSRTVTSRAHPPVRRRLCAAATGNFRFGRLPASVSGAPGFCAPIGTLSGPRTVAPTSPRIVGAALSSIAAVIGSLHVCGFRTFAGDGAAGRKCSRNTCPPYPGNSRAPVEHSAAPISALCQVGIRRDMVHRHAHQDLGGVQDHPGGLVRPRDYYGFARIHRLRLLSPASNPITESGPRLKFQIRSTSMRAVVMNGAGGRETLEYVERPDPV